MFIALACLAAVLALPPERDTWIELRTPDVTVFSHAGRARAERVATSLEDLRAVLAAATSWELAPFDTEVFVFRDDRALTPYKNTFEGRTVEGAGYLLARPGGNLIALDGSAPELERIVFHEAVHDAVSRHVPDMPLWLGEGLAEVFSTVRVRGGQAEAGRPVADHVDVLQREGWLPWAKLFAVDPSSALYNEGIRRGVFYAQSWALAHLLLTRGALEPCLERLADGTEPGAALAEVLFLGSSDDALGKLEKYLRGYVRKPPVRSVGLRRVEQETSVEVRALPYVEVLRRLGTLLIELERYDAAAEHLDAALRRGGDDAQVRAALALLHQRAAGPRAAGAPAAAGAPGARAKILVPGRGDAKRWEEALAAAVPSMNQLLAEKRFEEAADVLRRVDVPRESPQGTWIAEQVASIERRAAKERFLGRFNEALGHLEAGDARRAAEILEDLLAVLPEDSPEAGRARVLLRKARDASPT